MEFFLTRDGKLLVNELAPRPHNSGHFTVDACVTSQFEQHLRAVIDEIESSPIHLVAIGTGQDVGRYYRHAVTVRRAEAVAEILFERLGDLLTQGQSVEYA